MLAIELATTRANALGLQAFIGIQLSNMAKINESLSRWNTTEDFGLQVARGHIRGHRIIHVFGYNPDVDAGIEETVWTYGGIYQHAPSPIQMTVSSGSVNDNSTGTGARIVYIRGINGTGNEIEEPLTLNGQTPVTTQNAYSEINSVSVISVGSGGVNEGQIYVGSGTVTAGVPAIVYGHIQAKDNQSMTGHWTVPLDHTGYLINGKISSGTEGVSDFVLGRLKLRTVDGISRTAAMVSFTNGVINFDFDYPIQIPSGACISATAETAKNNDKISSYFQLLLIKNEDTSY